MFAYAACSCVNTLTLYKTVRSRGGTCPDWADSIVQYTAVLDLKASIPKPPVLFQYPVFALAHSNIGGCIEKKGRLQEAKEHYLKAIAIVNASGNKNFDTPFISLAKLNENEFDLIDNAKQYFKVSDLCLYPLL